MDTLYQFLEHADARILRRSTARSVGYDLFPVSRTLVPPTGTRIVDTGVRVVLPSGCYGKIESRSGLAARENLFVVAGVIDPDYTGTLKVVLVNCGSEQVEVTPTRAVAQLVLVKCLTPDTVLLLPTMNHYRERHSLAHPGSERLDDGFGSTDHARRDLLPEADSPLDEADECLHTVPRSCI